MRARFAIAVIAPLLALLPWIIPGFEAVFSQARWWLSAVVMVFGLLLYGLIVRIEGRIRLDEDLLDQLLRHSAQGLVLYDHNHRTLFANDQSIRNWGIDRKLAPVGDHVSDIGKRFISKLLHKPIRLAAEDIEQRARAMIQRQRASFSNARTNGGLLTSDLYPIGGGGSLWIQTNLQEREAFIDELVKAKEIAEQSNKLKTEFLSRMSHEVRTPLNAILGFSEIIASRIFGNDIDRYVEYGRNIHQSGEHIIELLDGVLDLARIEAGRYDFRTSDFDLRECIGAAISMISLGAERKGVSIQYPAPVAPISIHADAVALRQIVLNMLSNAVKFTPEGGKVSVLVLPRGDEVEIRVSDTGLGINPEDMAHLFQPFRRGTSNEVRNTEGSGLGLVITKHLVEKHGGTIEIASKPNEGTTVTVRIPLQATDPASRD